MRNGFIQVSSTHRVTFAVLVAAGRAVDNGCEARCCRCAGAKSDTEPNVIIPRS